MATELGIGLNQYDNPVIEFKRVKVTHIYPAREGVSNKTGEGYKIVNFNVAIALKDDFRYNYMTVTAFTSLAEQMGNIKEGDIVDIQVDFNVSGNKFPTTDVRLVDIAKSV